MKLKVNLKARVAEFTSNTDSTDTFKLKILRPNKAKLYLEGLMRGQQVKIEFKRFDEKQFPLIKTGFNWINEYPNNQ